MNYKGRTQKVASYLKKESLGAAFIEDPVSLLYFTGLSLSKGMLLITSDGEAALFVDKRYLGICSLKSPIPSFFYEEKGVSSFLSSLNKGDYVVVDGTSLTYNRVLSIQKVCDRCGLTVKNSPFLEEIMAVKEEEEIQRLKQSHDLLCQGMKHLKENIKVGVSEKELSWSFEKFCREKGADKMAFDPIIAFSANSAYPHHTPSERRFKKGDNILCDVGLSIDGYQSDMTRVFFEKEEGELYRAYEFVKRLFFEVAKKALPGTPVRSLALFINDEFKKGGHGPLIHALGHGIGLKVHEYPIIRPLSESSIRLKEGMVLAIEPALYFEGVGGVRYENMLLVTKEGGIPFDSEGV